MDLNTFIQAHLLKRSPLSYALYPSGVLYGYIQKQCRTYSRRRAYRAPCKIISIGNIISGGSGKTPLTISLANLLINKGLKVAVSHRGYKSAFENEPHIINADSGMLYDIHKTGDEAYLIASALLKVPVAVGRKRVLAVKLLLEKHPSLDVIILDDALQHNYIHRDLDIISFDASIGLGNGFVLPAGYLREPLSNIPQNSLIIINRKNKAQTETLWLNKINQLKIPIYHSSNTPKCFLDITGNVYPLDYLKEKRIVLVSGIANPASFADSVSSVGLSYVKHYACIDHCDFKQPSLIENILELNPDYILCTQKDIMKLAKYESLQNRLLALKLEYSFDQEDEFLNQVLNFIK